MSKSKGIPVMPVYPWWLRINPLSKHKGVFPSMGGLSKEEWPHVELSTARGLIPVFQKFSERTRIDGQVVALHGHDFGPFAPHFCSPIDNSWLALTAVGTSCKWPVTAGRRKIEGKSPCAFQQLIVPYLHCVDRPGKDEGAGKSDKGPAGKKFAGKAASEKQPPPGFAESLPGLGHFMIPTGPQTVTLHINGLDCLLAAARLLVDLAFDTAWKRYSALPGKRRSGLQPRAAKRLSTRDVARELGDSVLDKAASDYVKGVVTSGELKAPFELASFELESGKLVIWTREIEDTGWTPIEYRGVNEALEDPAGARAALDELIGEVPFVG